MKNICLFFLKVTISLSLCLWSLPVFAMGYQDFSKFDRRHSNLLEIISPKKFEKLNVENVKIVVNFSDPDRVKPSSFKAMLNGKNITDRFEEVENGMKALVSLRDGLRIHIEGENRRIAGWNRLVTAIRGFKRMVDVDVRIFYVLVKKVEITPCVDNDGDTYDTCDAGVPGDDGKPIDCNDDDETIYPGAVESCDGKDNDCNESTLDGTSEPWFGVLCDGADSDQCLEGSFFCSEGFQDCSDDTEGSIEICDGQDNDCDAEIDEGFTLITYYRDADSDGYGDPSVSVQACSPPSGYVEDETDCDDNNETINTGVTETSYSDPICYDLIDNDCDGSIDTEDHGCQYLLENLLVVPDPNPCEQISTLCESALIGPYIIFSTTDDTGILTIVNDESGEIMSLDWIRAGDFTDLIVTLSEYPPLDPLHFENELPSLRSANAIAAVILGLGASPLEANSQITFAQALSGNHAGCDQIDGWTDELLRRLYPWLPQYNWWISCSRQGACCDDHDICIDSSCEGENGDLIKCLKRKALYDACVSDCSPESPRIFCEEKCLKDYPECSIDCLLCHMAVISCFLPWNLPGPSQCCKRGDCGDLQQCIVIDDPSYVETNPENCPAVPGDDGQADNGGDPHLVTFDRLAYDFQGVGEFILVRSLDESLEIQTRMKPWGSSRVVSINSAVAMNVAGDQVGIYVDRTPSLYVNGLPTTLGTEGLQLPFGGQIMLTQGGYTVIWPDNSQLRVNLRGSYLNQRILVPGTRKGRLKGLLGNFDGNRENELVTRDGVLIGNRPTFYELYKEYGESWRISQEESLFDYIDGNDTETHTNRIFPNGSVSSVLLSEITRQEAEQICRDAGVTHPVLLEACILDVGITGDSSFADFHSSMTPPEDAVLIDSSLGLCQVGGFALKFDGSNDLVTFGSVASLREHTFEAWVRPAPTGGGPIVVQNTGSGPACGEGIILGGGGGGLLCYDLNPAGCGTSNQVCDAVSTEDVWTHVAGTYDGELGRLYVNGELVAILDNVSFPITNYLRAGTYYFFSGGQSYYGGELDELRIWDHARTREELVNTMFVPLSGTEPGLRGYWKFDEGSGQDVLDSSTTGRNGVLGTSSGAQSSDPAWVPSEICVP